MFNLVGNFCLSLGDLSYIKNKICNFLLDLIDSGGLIPEVNELHKLNLVSVKFGFQMLRPTSSFKNRLASKERDTLDVFS